MRLLHSLFGLGQHTWTDNWLDTFQPHVEMRNCRYCGSFQTRTKGT